uniref:Serine/arginine repetitive matrix 1 n=1 Tax=Nothobranchius furzeri TaxID=105023 RepID=A0A1A7ZAQ8_NOTFU
MHAGHPLMLPIHTLFTLVPVLLHMGYNHYRFPEFDPFCWGADEQAPPPNAEHSNPPPQTPTRRPDLPPSLQPQEAKQQQRAWRPQPILPGPKAAALQSLTESEGTNPAPPQQNIYAHPCICTTSRIYKTWDIQHTCRDPTSKAPPRSPHGAGHPQTPSPEDFNLIPEMWVIIVEQ